ncbi:protein of unknown function [Georgfuchsia toluolica]|uniref:Uncharacterized protein n=1 Tax=Georgfuchsia toluolica TaxID=424218 RepID=A0A916J4I9_9PROT|nr:protein of unknown function [Georgfuchsia toluolica]
MNLISYICHIRSSCSISSYDANVRINSIAYPKPEASSAVAGLYLITFINRRNNSLNVV